MRKALFLDRDGVVNKEKNHLYKIDDFEFMDGIFNICKKFKKINFLVIIVTNQAGIARGLYTKDDFLRLTQWMKDRFVENGVTVDAVYYCPHHPDYTGDCDCRKPRPGMLIKAKRRFGINMEESILIGDKESDIEAGINAKVGKNILIRSDCDYSLIRSKADKIFKNLKDVI